MGKKIKTISIAIFGDSFSSDWRKKSADYCGWPNMLDNDFEIKNFSQAGVGEYKILQQIKKENLDKFDLIIVCHTSPTRCHTVKHPVHYNNNFHKNCDLLMSDIFYHSKKIRNIFNYSLHSAKNWFLYHYDEDYHREIYTLIRKEIDQLLQNKIVIEICNFDVPVNKNNIILDYKNYVKYNQNFSNHYDEKTNKKIFLDIKKIIKGLK